MNDLIDECPGLTVEQDRWLSRRVKELDFASTPQPTQAQAGAVPLTDEQTESLLWKYGYDPDDEHMAAMLKEAHEIKGGQHG